MGSQGEKVLSLIMCGTKQHRTHEFKAWIRAHSWAAAWAELDSARSAGGSGSSAAAAAAVLKEARAKACQKALQRFFSSTFHCSELRALEGPCSPTLWCAAPAEGLTAPA